jgi:hypothetical protein
MKAHGDGRRSPAPLASSSRGMPRRSSPACRVWQYRHSMTTIVRPVLDCEYETGNISAELEEESMSSPPASDVLPMAPAAAVPPMAPEAARALGLPRSTAWRGAGGIALQPGTANFLGRAADGRQPAAAPATAAEGRAQVVDRQCGIAAVAGRRSRRCDVPRGAAMERNRPGMEQIAGPLEQKRRQSERKSCLLERPWNRLGRSAGILRRIEDPPRRHLFSRQTLT